MINILSSHIDISFFASFPILSGGRGNKEDFGYEGRRAPHCGSKRRFPEDFNEFALFYTPKTRFIPCKRIKVSTVTDLSNKA